MTERSVEAVRLVLVQQASRDSSLMTDEAKWYKRVGREFAKHEAVNHSSGKSAPGSMSASTVATSSP